ncbi:2-methylpropanoate--CoA ligase CCL4-like [Mercurialis annua]|uniref:2-methylpropanoate--CoA ligase CCL4-like n=1 Tax=Mercurialis annua TaxID=3986 RepID=UPI00215E96B3|nr:2-methylpropanoate--CoA ligase CCL4-like [Mercurialis annua]
MEKLNARNPNSFPLTPLGFLDRAATVYGDCPSIIYNTTTYTWSQTHRRCLQLASSLVSIIGIKRGHVVSVLSPNVPAMYELHFAVPMAGAILSNLNTRLDARTISILLRHSESKLLFVDVLSKSLALEAISLFPLNIKPPVLVLITDDEVAAADDEMSLSPTVEFIDTYEGLMIKGDHNFKWVMPDSEWDPIVLNYTSGTTSSPKGVLHCHRGFFIITVDALIDWSVPKQPVFLWTLPMFHSNGWSYPWGMAAVGGVNVCLRRFDAAVIYRLILKHKVTHMCGAPVVLNMLANFQLPDDQALGNHRIRFLTGGAPPPATILYRMEELGFVVSHGYGLTEAGGIVISCAWKSKWNRLPATERARLKARQGVGTLAMSGIDVVNPATGESVKRDGVAQGEIVLRGPCVMLGYFKDPESTSKCMTNDGWFYTGDVAVMHADGYLEIKDRSKDVIISGGENLSSVEVESVLYTNPVVNEAAVVAKPDEYWGETPCAFVSLKRSNNGGGGGGDLSAVAMEKEIIEYCRARLPHYMVPKTVVVKDELPKTSTGKIQKSVLREMAKVISRM